MSIHHWFQSSFHCNYNLPAMPNQWLIVKFVEHDDFIFKMCTRTCGYDVWFSVSYTICGVKPWQPVLSVSSYF